MNLTGCDYLDNHSVSGGELGIKYGKECDIIDVDMDIVNRCVVECPYPECVNKTRDDRKEKRKVMVWSKPVSRQVVSSAPGR